MNISISDKNILYSYLNEIGYYGLDILFDSFDKKEYILSDEYIAFIEEKTEKIVSAGLKVCQTHLTYYPGHIKPIGKGTYDDYEEYMLPIFIREIKLTKMMNCKICVIHPYFEKDKALTRRGNISLFSKLLPVAEEFGVALAIENIYGPNYCDAHISTYEDFMYYIDYFKSSYLGVCLDTGHAIILNQDPVKLFVELKEHVVALHLHTTVENIDLHAIPYMTSYGEKIDWTLLYNEIKNSDYSGSFNMELRPPENISEEAKKAYYLLAYNTAKTIMGHYDNTK